MNRLDAFCDAIKEFEGWFPGSKSWRNNNPGNLRHAPTQIGIDPSGYAKFTRFSTGWGALLADVTGKCTGHTRTKLTPESTILEFFEVYAPSSDGNHPHTYCDYVCLRAKLSPTMQLKEILENVDV